MTQPITKKSVDAATSAATGADTRALGHYHTTLFVVARNLDSANDSLSVVLEGSPDQQHWTGVDEATADKKITESDFSEDPDNSGVYTASITITGSFHEFLRVRVSEFTDSAGGDLEVDGWLMAAGNEGQGRKGTGRKGPVSNLDV